MRGALLKLSAMIIVGILSIAGLHSRDLKQTEELSFGTGFFDQLLTLFGRFRNADLQKAFAEAQPIQCSELIWRKGEWRPVAFFNENRRLGSRCRWSLEEVKADLTVFTFKGSCGNEGESIKLVSKFPTESGVNSYRRGKIDLDQVDVILNDPVAVFMKSATDAYTFELPCLYSKKDMAGKLFSFNPPGRGSVCDESVSSFWECKAVFSKDLTYRFMICRVSTVQRHLRIDGGRNPAVGEKAFFILSDGTQAQTTVKMITDEDAGKSAVP